MSRASGALLVCMQASVPAVLTTWYPGEEPLYPFGYGVSYTQFRYGNLRVGRERVEAGGEVEVSAGWWRERV